MSNDPVKIFDSTSTGGRRTRALRFPSGSVQITVNGQTNTIAFDILSREDRIALGRALLADVEPAPVYAVCEYDNSDGGGDYDGNIVIELYTSNQTAEQHQRRMGPMSYIRKMIPRTKLREY